MTQHQQVVGNQVSFTITEQQYQKSMWLHMKQRTWRGATIVFTILVVLFAIVDGLATAVPMGIFFALYLAFMMWIVRRNVGRIYRSMPQLHGEQTVQFNEEGLVWHNAYALSKVKWQLFQKFDSNEDVYLLYQGPHLFNMIPRSAFYSDEQEEAFRMLLEINVKSARPRRPKRAR